MIDRVTILLTLVALIGCDEGRDGASLAYDPEACVAFTLPTGLGLSWENLNHRISLWQLQLEPTPAEACTADTLSVAYIGGDFSTGETMTDVPSQGPSAEQILVEVQGPPGAQPGLYGWTRFRFELDPPEASDMGYYVRDLEVSLSLDELDGARGVARFSARGYASNASKFLAFYGMGCDFEGAFAWVPVDLNVTPVTQRAAFETGATALTLEGPP